MHDTAGYRPDGTSTVSRRRARTSTGIRPCEPAPMTCTARHRLRESLARERKWQASERGDLRRVVRPAPDRSL